jgi:hydrogenase/urease accessory protein HupE
MKRLFTVRTLALAAAAFAAPLAWAHPGHGVAGHAFFHPFTGIDDLLAMLAIVAFVAIVVGGAALANRGRGTGERIRGE